MRCASAALEAVRAAEDEDIDTAETHNTGGNSDGETETLRWLEDELADVWARSESGNPSGLPRGLGRHGATSRKRSPPI